MSLASRRTLLAGAAASGLAVLLPATATAAAESDLALVTGLTGVELLSLAVLEHVLHGDHLGPRGHRLARRIQAHERIHLSRLLGPLHRLGGSRPHVPEAPAELDLALSTRHVNRRLADLNSEHDALDLLLDLEGMAEGAYYDALGKLTDPALAELAGGILAVEGQHEALLGALRHPKDYDRATPYAFVEGIKP